MDTSALTGREIIIEVELYPTPENRAAFMEAMLDGKFGGMTPECIERFRAEAREQAEVYSMAESAEAFRTMDDDLYVDMANGRITAEQAIRITVERNRTTPMAFAA